MGGDREDARGWPLEIERTWSRFRGAQSPSAGTAGARGARRTELMLSGPRVPDDPHLEGRVQPSTLLTYRRRAAEFYEWCLAEGASPWTPDEWGDTLMDYKATSALLKSHFTSLIAAVEFKFPRLKGRLCRCHAALRGWELEHQTKHTVPMVSTAQAFMCVQLCVRGVPRLGVGVVLQGKVGMRPSEMLGIVTSDLIFPEEAGYVRGQGPLVIGLGIKANTKAKRPQSNSILESAGPVLVGTLRLLKARTAPGGRLFPYTLEKYRKLLTSVQTECKTQMGWTPHSPRAGFASEASAWGMSFEQIRENGRWKVDSSLRVYIDMVQAANIAIGLKRAGWGPAFDWSTRHWAWVAARALHGAEGGQA